MRSDQIKKGLKQAPARAMLRAVGVGDEDFGRPFVGVVNTFTDGMPCNFHLRELAQHLKAGLKEAGLFPFEFGAPAISDGISMGTPGMRASLVSREVIADSVELIAQGYLYDGMVGLSACDKTIPGTAMGVIRSGVPGMILYGGTIAPGEWQGRKLTIVEVFEAVGQRAAGKISEEELLEIERRAIPGPGPAAASTPPTPWPWPSRPWASPPWATTPSPPSTPKRSGPPRRRGKSSPGPSPTTGSPRTSSPGKASSTPSPPWPPRGEHQRRPPPPRPGQGSGGGAQPGRL